MISPEARFIRWEAGRPLGSRPGAETTWWTWPASGEHFLGRAIPIMAVISLMVPVLVLDILTATLLASPLSGTLPAPRPVFHSQATQVYDATGAKIASFHQYQTSLPMTPGDVPTVLKQAVVASEDRRFYDHRGVDARAILRAMWADLKGGSYLQGASTIDQQYVRLVYGSDQKTLQRKAHEALLAGLVDRRLTKDQILYGYLSRVYMGEGLYGVEAASESYFRKPVRNLTLSEAALLASILPAPTLYNPRSDPTVAETRREAVLDEMAAQHRITDAQLNDALAARVVLAGVDPPPVGPATLVYPPKVEQSPYPWFADYVRRYLVARYGAQTVDRGGLRVETSLDPRLQAEAEKAVATALHGTQPPLDMAMVVVDPRNGLVKAMIGGRDFAKSQVNLALGNCPPSPTRPPPGMPFCIGGGGSGRQPGSAFKPFTLAAAFEEGMSPDRVYNGPSTYTFPSSACKGAGCTVHNAESGGFGPINLREATAYSVNTVFAQLIEDVGVKKVAAMAHRLGITMVNADGKDPSGQPYGPSLTLGAADVSPLDMAAAYSVFASHGMQFPVTPVTRVIAPGGKVLEDNTDRHGRQVLAPYIADQVTSLLQGVIAMGTGTAANIGWPDGSAGKTGTAQNFTDAWFVGYTPLLTTSVWMGYTDASRPLDNIKGIPHVFGGTLPAQAWHDFMTAALAGIPPQQFQVTPPPPPPPPPTTVAPSGPVLPPTATVPPTPAGPAYCFPVAYGGSDTSGSSTTYGPTPTYCLPSTSCPPTASPPASYGPPTTYGPVPYSPSTTYAAASANCSSSYSPPPTYQSPVTYAPPPTYQPPVTYAPPPTYQPPVTSAPPPTYTPAAASSAPTPSGEAPAPAPAGFTSRSAPR